MGFFSNRYMKEGPGVRKDEPEKKGLARFFELLGRDYSAVWAASAITWLCFLPAVFSLVIGNIFVGYLGMMLIAALLYVLSSLLVGPALAGLYAVGVNAVRNIPSYMWHTYKKAWRDNAKQSMPFGVLLMVLLAVDVIMFNYSLEKGESIWLFILVIFSLLVVSCCALLVLLQILFIDLPLLTMMRNSVMLLFGFAKRAVPGGLIVFVVMFACGWLFYLPVALTLMLLGVPALLVLISCMWLWPVMENAFHITERQEEKRKEQEVSAQQ